MSQCSNPIQCVTAKRTKCTCACRGQNHGILRSFLDSENPEIRKIGEEKLEFLKVQQEKLKKQKQRERRLKRTEKRKQEVEEAKVS